MSKVFSIKDFRRGVDLRRSPLTAPGGSLRILENAMLNPGGEIEKRKAFVQVTNNPTPSTPWCWIGQGGTLHVFGCPTAPNILTGTSPVPIVQHNLAGAPETIIGFRDVENYGDKFYVCGVSATRSYNWYDGVLVNDVGGAPIRSTYARTYKTKMYNADNFTLTFSGVNNPAERDPADTSFPGAGFIDTSKNDPDVEPVLAMEVFYGQMAVFSRLATQLWNLDPDPDKDTLLQVIRSGTVSAQSVYQLFTGDVLYLSDSGIRSLKAMNVTSMTASVSDVGSALDPLITDLVLSLPIGTYSTAKAVVQPRYGRYWLNLNNVVYVLSYFPAGEITAWSMLLPEFNIKDMVVVSNYVFLAGTAGPIYLYGGPAQDTYDSCRVRVRTPHHDADKPTENKRIQSIDVACRGQWSLTVGMLPNNVDAFELVANINNNTFGNMSIPFAGYGTHFGMHLENAAPGPALLSAIHVNLQEGVTK